MYDPDPFRKKKVSWLSWLHTEMDVSVAARGQRWRLRHERRSVWEQERMLDVAALHLELRVPAEAERSRLSRRLPQLLRAPPAPSS